MTTAVLSPSTSSSSLPSQADNRQRWWPVLQALLVVTLLVPLLNLALPEGHPLHVSDYLVTLLGKMQCFALCALALDLVWGFTGILSLGHGLFFALGAYAMGMALMVEAAGPGNLPAFMVFLDWKRLPWHWSLLKQMLNRRGGDLSGGQQQQLAIARALAAGPQVLILDEPTEGIQPSVIKDIGRVIRGLAERGHMAIILVEQYYDFAEELADQYLVMERGEIIARGPGSEMAARSVRELVSV